jgi:hypothetical protein
MQGVETLAAVSILLLGYLLPAVNYIIELGIIILNNLVNILDYTIRLIAGINVSNISRQFF